MTNARSLSARVVSVGVVIPTLNEARLLPGLLDHLARIATWNELAVVDGGSSDRTIQLASAHPSGPQVWCTSGGRAAQLNHAFARLRSEVVLVLPADARVRADALATVRSAYANGGLAGCLRLVNSRRTPLFRWQDAWARLRARWTGGAYLDQAPFFARRAALARGGFRELAGYDTADLGRRLSGRRAFIVTSAPVVASCRHWQRLGVVRGICAHQRARMRHLFGIQR